VDERSECWQSREGCGLAVGAGSGRTLNPNPNLLKPPMCAWPRFWTASVDGVCRVIGFGTHGVSEQGIMLAEQVGWLGGGGAASLEQPETHSLGVSFHCRWQRPSFDFPTHAEVLKMRR